MFKRPEELIMAVLAALWVVFTYFLASYFGAPTQTALLITAFTLIWAALFCRFCGDSGSLSMVDWVCCCTLAQPNSSKVAQIVAQYAAVFRMLCARKAVE